MSHPAARPARGWDPFGELQALRAELSRLIGADWSPPDVDMTEDNEGWTVTVRLPGVAPEEVEVDLDERDLHVRARSEAEVNAAMGGEAAGSRRRGFDYRVTIPGETDPEQVDATMDHGLLTVRLPRSARSRRRRITIGQRNPTPAS